MKLFRYAAALSALAATAIAATKTEAVAAVRDDVHPLIFRALWTRDDEMARVAQAAFGHSGMLRAVFVDPSRPVPLPLEWAARPAGDVWYEWRPQSGTRPAMLLGNSRLSLGLVAPAGGGIWTLHLAAGPWSQDVGALSVITRVPFDAKRDGYLNGYHIGSYPTEGDPRGDVYDIPPGFIEVTPQNQDTRVSEHFRLRDFLTKDQFDVWPKYLALDTRLIDKLELVIQELNAMGVRAQGFTVMSGYRTPQYNAVGSENRARLSRHMYGDASDVWVDNDGNGVMDDLNGDGVVDDHDGDVILRAVERVEAAYPDLTGGCGVYLSGDTHGPFVHIDARGFRARW